MEDTDAKTIATALLQDTRLEMFGGSYDVWISSFALPQEVQTFDGQQILETVEDLRALYHTLSAHLSRRGITDIVRYVIAAEFRDPNVIHSTHETRLMRVDGKRDGFRNDLGVGHPHLGRCRPAQLGACLGRCLARQPGRDLG
ncbi:hypothetical protein [Tateyamaria sp.]|uniref:hypothetical protein n=1 Tax=Tateyamaria sp. TaxID=1929288 RepID=UPI003B21804A